jgi:hypothetical protein
MSAVDEILSQIPLQQLAGQLGVDPQTAEQATRQALPALLGGIQANTADPGGAASFAQAVQQHDGSLVDGGVDLSQVDTGVGQQIVGHVFGENQGQVVNQLGAIGGVGGQALIQKLLPILAPIVMSYLASKLLGGGGAAAPAAPAAGGGGIGDVLGGLLGSVLGGGGGAAQSAGPDLGSLLGGLLGGGRK